MRAVCIVLVKFGILTGSCCRSETKSLQWCHNQCNGISYHQPHVCLLNHLFKRRSKKTSKLRITGLCEGNSLVTGEFPTQRASNMENVSIWWCHPVVLTSSSPILTHCGIVMPYDYVAWWYQAITWTNVNLSSMAYPWEQFHKNCSWITCVWRLHF